jgi:hypothetical protein
MFKLPICMMMLVATPLTLHLQNTIACVCHYVMLHCAVYFVSNPNNKRQYYLKAGLKTFAERGNDALMKELCQIHLLRYFSPKDPKTLPHQDRRNCFSQRNAQVKSRLMAVLMAANSVDTL